MKKFLSILFSFLILLSGMHFSIATHFCGERISDWKMSLDEEVASCGMCNPVSSADYAFVPVSCCKNHLSVLDVDNDYQPSQIKHFTLENTFLSVLQYSRRTALPPVCSSLLLSTSVKPPGEYNPEAVLLAGICVFRI